MTLLGKGKLFKILAYSQSFTYYLDVLFITVNQMSKGNFRSIVVSHLVLLRHGMSEWNKLDLFTGWVDVDLAPDGVLEAKAAASAFRQAKISFDIGYASVLKRSIKTAWHFLGELSQESLPLSYHWRLNERHYGALQGKNKTQTVATYGAEQVKLWRRSYDVSPPLSLEDSAQDLHSMRYFPGVDIPKGESLQQTAQRVMPFYQDCIAPQLASGHNVLVVAHGNSLRALMMKILDLSKEQVLELEVPTATCHHYVIDEKTLKVTDQQIYRREK